LLQKTLVKFAKKAMAVRSEYLVIWPTFELGSATFKVFGVIIVHFNCRSAIWHGAPVSMHNFICGVELRVFYISALDGGEWSTLHSCRLVPKK
jgi:hypothetical protein